MHLVIATVDQVFFDGEAHSVTLPGAEGEMTVLGQHMPLITTLRQGTLVVRTAASHAGQEHTQQMAIGGGILEVNREGATVIL